MPIWNIIKRSNKADIKNIIENPEILKYPIEKYSKKHKNYFDINPFEIQRRKSFIINNTLFLKKNKLFEIGNEPKIYLNIKKDKEKSTDNSFRKDLNLYINTENNNSINLKLSLEIIIYWIKKIKKRRRWIHIIVILIWVY